jgi:hypothetical protein
MTAAYAKFAQNRNIFVQKNYLQLSCVRYLVHNALLILERSRDLSDLLKRFNGESGLQFPII